MTAAIRWPDGRVDTGLTHFLALGERVYEDVQGLCFEEGFVTLTGRFVDRLEAGQIVGQSEGLHTGDYL